MASVTIRVAGLSELGKNLATFKKEIKDKAIRKAARAAANEVRDTAKAILVSKGLVGDEPIHVRDAIAARRMSKISKDGKEFFAVGVFKIGRGKKTGKPLKYANTKLNRRMRRVGKSYEVDAPEFYWKFLEFGTVKMSAKPFLRPAFDAKKQGSPETMAKVLKQSMDSATRKLAKQKRQGL